MSQEKSPEELRWASWGSGVGVVVSPPEEPTPRYLALVADPDHDDGWDAHHHGHPLPSPPPSSGGGLPPTVKKALGPKPEALPDAELTASIACKICQEQPVDTLTEPCNHVAMCRWCAEEWSKSDLETRRWQQPPGLPEAQFSCPICREKVTAVRHIHLV